MTTKELYLMVEQLKKVFEKVQLIDANLQNQINLAETADLEKTAHKCYAILNKEHPCQNCISQKTLAQKSQLSTFELMDGHVYHMISKYVEVNGQPYILEMANRISDETRFSAFGKWDYLKNILESRRKLYFDALTGAYNRRFFEEKFCSLENQCAVAFVDIDRFKSVNDTFGHDAGDKVLKSVVSTIISKVRPEDVVVRYGGEEFVLSFVQMPKDVFVRRLEELRLAVKSITLADYPEIKITISIGGYYCNNADRMEMVREADNLCYEAKVTRDSVKVKLN